jgi:hypothetical protein
MAHKSVKQSIVTFANTSSKPDTVVVKLEHTVIANVAVASSWGSKNETSFAKFKLEAHR